MMNPFEVGIIQHCDTFRLFTQCQFRPISENAPLNRVIKLILSMASENAIIEKLFLLWSQPHRDLTDGTFRSTMNAIDMILIDFSGDEHESHRS